MAAEEAVYVEDAGVARKHNGHPVAAVGALHDVARHAGQVVGERHEQVLRGPLQPNPTRIQEAPPRAPRRALIIEQL